MNTSLDSTESMVDHAKRLITIYFPGHLYSVRFQHIKENIPKTFISVDSPTSTCIKCDIFDHDPSTLHVYILLRCGNPSEQEGKYIGSYILSQLIQFATACGFSQITLEDESIVMYDTTDGPIYKQYYINLQHLLRLKTGESWYERFGFTNKKIIEHKESLNAYIHQSIGSVDPKLLHQLKQFHQFKQLFQFQNNIPNIEHITDNTTVSEVVTALYDYLNALCPNRMCSLKSYLMIVNKIDSIIKHMYLTMITHIGAEEKDFYELSLAIPSIQKGSSRRRKNKTRKRKRTRRTK